MTNDELLAEAEHNAKWLRERGHNLSAFNMDRLAAALRDCDLQCRGLMLDRLVERERAERAEAALLSIRSQLDHATTMLAAWEQLWDGIRDNHVPGLREDNKPLAVAASYEIVCRERDELKRNIAAELEGAQALREQHGARENESFPAFVGRLKSERDAAIALLRLLADGYTGGNYRTLADSDAITLYYDSGKGAKAADALFDAIDAALAGGKDEV